MFLISILVVLLMIVLTILMGGGASNFVGFIDVPTLLILILIVVPIMLGTNMLKDFNNAFRIAMTKKKEYSMPELKKALEAVKLAMQILIYSGLLLTFIALILILRYAVMQSMDIYMVMSNLSIAVLGIVYALVANIVLLSVKAKINRLIIDFVQE